MTELRIRVTLEKNGEEVISALSDPLRCSQYDAESVVEAYDNLNSYFFMLLNNSIANEIRRARERWNENNKGAKKTAATKRKNSAATKTAKGRK